MNTSADIAKDASKGGLPTPKVPAEIPAILPPVSLRGKLRLNAMAGLHRMTDAGWFGLTPLRAHVVIVGYPRSGSTMLYLMVHNCVENVRVFNKECSALRMAWYAWRNNSFMVTKRPLDTFFTDDIREYYRSQPAQCRFIVLVRDPRAVLTSIHVKHSGYFVTVERWRALYEHIQYIRHSPDAVVVDFNELVTNIDAVQQRLESFIGWKVHRPFSEFHGAENKTLETRAMNGVRPLDPTAIDKWRSEKHRPRICELLREMPDLPQILIDWGYEPDDRWVEAYTRTS